MEQFKTFDEIQRMDITHSYLGQITGRLMTLEQRHAYLSTLELHDSTPEAVKGQFNVARNMTLYQHFFYALAPEVQMKTYSVIEMALRLRLDAEAKPSLAQLLKRAVDMDLLKDEGFRHIASPDPSNPYSRSLVQVLPMLRNDSAHGSTQLTPDCIGHIEKCADLINQLFKNEAIAAWGVQDLPKPR